EEVSRLVGHSELTSRMLYWRGFARWRRAMNGAGTDDVNELENDLMRAAADFREAAARDPRFVEAEATEAFCLVNVAALNPGGARARELFRPAMTRFNAALAGASDNPRVLWMHGANQFYQPADLGGGHALAIATYQNALNIARRQKHRVADPLD